MVVLRRIFFYLFVGLYLVACPLTILYTLGFLIHPLGPEGVVRTGLIALSSTPSGASVYVENRRYSQQTPVILRGLLPGAYHLRVVKKGYRPWQAVVPVESEQATALAHVLLLPIRLHGRPLLPEAVEELIPVPSGHVFLLAAGPNLEDLVVYDWKTEHAESLVPFGSSLRGGRVLSKFFVPDSPAVLLQVRLEGDDRFLWVEPGTAPPTIKDITRLFPEKPLQVVWDPRQPRYLFSLQRRSLNRLDIATDALYPQWVERVRGVACLDRAVYVLTEEAMLARVDEEGHRAEVLWVDPLPERALVGQRSLFQLTALPDKTVVLAGERGELLVTMPPYQLVDRGVRGIEPDPRRSRMLFWQKRALGMVAFSEETDEVAEVDEHGTAQLQWLYRAGKDIEQAFWVYEGSHVLLRDADRIVLLELNAFGTPNPQQLLEVKRKSAVAYVEATGQLYYVDPATERLSALEVVPREALVSFPFSGHREGASRPHRVGRE